MNSYTFYVSNPVSSRQRIDVIDGQVIATWSNPDNSMTRVDHNPFPFIATNYKDLQQV